MTITENLTGVVKEEPKTITEFFDEIKSNICDNYCKYPSEIKDYDELKEVKQEMCDGYCKHPTQVDSREDLFADDSPCMECPLTKL